MMVLKDAAPSSDRPADRAAEGETRRTFLLAPLALLAAGCGGGERTKAVAIMDRRTPEQHIAYRVRQPGMGIEIDFQFTKPGSYVVQAFMSYRERVTVHEWKTLSAGDDLPRDLPRGAYVQYSRLDDGGVNIKAISMPTTDDRWAGFLDEVETMRCGHPVDYMTLTAEGTLITRVARLDAYVPTADESTRATSRRSNATDTSLDVMRCPTIPSLVQVLFAPAGGTELKSDVVPVDLGNRWPSGVR